MPAASAQDMEDARRRNIMASERAMLPIAYQPELLPARAVIEIKIDGIGLLDLNGRLETLEAVPFLAAQHLGQELALVRDAFDTEMVLHGEYFEHGGFNATLAAFQRGVGAGAVILWDAVPLKVWHGLELSAPLVDRRAMLSAAISAVRPQMVAFSPRVESGGMELWIDPTPDLIQTSAEAAWAAGQEGVVVKDADSPYSRGRSPFWLKVKQTVTVDVPIQGIRTDGSGTLSSIIVTVDGKPAVVPTGFSQDERMQPDEFRSGRMVEISYVGKYPSGALKGARFIRFRDDKASAL